MDYQCLFRQDQENYLQHWRSGDEKFSPQPCSYVVFRHLLDSAVEVSYSDVTDSDVINVLQDTSESQPSQERSQLRVLLTPARKPLVDREGRRIGNSEAPLPFTRATFDQMVEILDFHKGFFSRQPHGQVARLDSGQNIKSFYIESFPYDSRWFKVFVAFNPQTQLTSVMLHNLLAEELQFIHNKLNETTLQALTIHPMFVLVILMELLFNGIQEAAQVVFGDSIRLRLEANLFGNEVFKHLIEENLGIEEAAAKAFGNEQWILTALEEMEFTVKMGCKFISWCKDFELADATEYQKVRFDTAGQIICNRLEYMVNGLDLQLIRVRRAQNQSRLNRTGLETRNATIGNKFNARISEQSRDIARESRRDSSAMKAIAVLTMFFLPGTFVAAFFAMPLFDWSAPNSSPITTSRFWIYWAVTIPATIFVLGIWRVWYKFQEWRDWTGKGKSFAVDFWFWLRSGSFKIDEEAADGRTKPHPD